MRMEDALDLKASSALAWIDEDGALSYAELASEVRRTAERLRDAGLRPFDRAVLTPPLERESVLALLALLAMRATVVLAHPRWTAHERERIVERTEPRLVLEASRVLEVRESVLHREPGPALVVFTSGTTGEPKGVCLSRRALIAAAEAHAGALPWEPNDRWLLAMPLAHVGGASVVLRSVHAQRAVVLGPERFDADALLERAREHEATLLSVVPTMLEKLLPRRPPASVRAVLLGGAACPSELLARGRALGWPLLPTYGLSECCAQVCTQRLGDPRPSGVGPPLPGVELRVVEGGIEVRGPTRMDGFWGERPLDPGAWLRTGDAGRIDERGHLHVLGRLDDRIVTGGENVDPTAVEDALSSHPNVAAACVVGVADPSWGQRVTALIVPRGEPPTLESLRAHLEPRLARFAHPRALRLVDALPLTRAGKLDRRAARALVHDE